MSKPSTVSIYRFSVQGIVDFPADLLRKQKCWPSRDVDAISMASSYNWSNGGVPRVVLLEGLMNPDFAEWKKFGWTQCAGSTVGKSARSINPGE